MCVSQTTAIQGWINIVKPLFHWIISLDDGNAGLKFRLLADFQIFFKLCLIMNNLGFQYLRLYIYIPII